jgi:hypothetical protein
MLRSYLVGGARVAEWLKLSSSLFELQEQVGNSIATEAAVENAVRSQAVPVRAWTGGAFARIEAKISDKSTVSVLNSNVRLKRYSEYVEVRGGNPNDYADVEVDVLKFESWLLENAIPAEATVETDASSPSMANAEHALKTWLRKQPESPRPTKALVQALINDGKHELGRLGTSLSARGFNRAWASAAHKSWRRGGRRPARSGD